MSKHNFNHQIGYGQSQSTSTCFKSIRYNWVPFKF